MIRLKNADMQQSDFDDINFADTRFHNINLTGTRFSNVDMSGVQFEDICLAGAQIRDARGLDSMTIEGISVADLLKAWELQQNKKA